MKKYKLIREYPGSPELGTISKNEGGMMYYFKDYPEFWEEVVEKDYEILSVINPLQNNCEVLEDLNNGYSFEYKLNKFPYLKIKSVKRLSDGEVFTVGDKVNNITFGGKGIIKSIRPLGNNYVVFKIDFDEEYEDSDDSECFLKNLQHVKPLFTTEDGVDIFEGNILYSVNNLFNLNKNVAGITVFDNCKIFSTKEAAEEYILMNKRCLSINDILSNNYFIERLKDIVKSRS